MRLAHTSDDLDLSSLDGLLLAPLSEDRDLIVIIEGKSSFKSSTPHQIMDYHEAVRRWYRRRHPGKRAPAILPVAVYNGRRKWKASFALSRPEDIVWLVDALLRGGPPVFGYVLLDLVHETWDWDALVSSPEARARLAALTWQRSDGEEAAREVVRMVVRATPGSQGLQGLRRQLHRYFLEGMRMDAGFMERTWYHVLPEIKEDPEVTALVDEWKAEGRTEGQQTMLQTMLQEQLESLGPLTATARKRISEASLEQLKSWPCRRPHATARARTTC